MTSHPDAPDHDGRQQCQRQQAAHHAQLLADDSEDKVGVTIGQRGAVLALGLGAVEQPLPRELAAAQRHQAAGLLPAGVLHVQRMVEQHLKPELHVLGHLVQVPQRPEAYAAQHAADGEPVQGHTGYEAHADEDKQEHQGAAHVGGHLIVEQEDHAEVDAQKQDGWDTAEVAVLLEPRQLLGQHQCEGELHDLGGLHLYGEEREIQPGAVAGIILDTQRRHQQENKDNARQKYPLPVFGQVVQIHLGHQQVQYHAQQQGRRLDRHQTPGMHVAGGAGHHEDTEQGCRRAQRQQYQIRLAQDVGEKVAGTTEHGRVSFPVGW